MNDMERRQASRAADVVRTGRHAANAAAPAGQTQSQRTATQRTASSPDRGAVRSQQTHTARPASSAQAQRSKSTRPAFSAEVRRTQANRPVAALSGKNAAGHPGAKAAAASRAASAPKKLTLKRRWRRLCRKRPWVRSTVPIGALAVCLVVVIAVGASLTGPRRQDVVRAPEAQIAAPALTAQGGLVSMNGAPEAEVAGPVMTMLTDYGATDASAENGLMALDGGASGALTDLGSVGSGGTSTLIGNGAQRQATTSPTGTPTVAPTAEPAQTPSAEIYLQKASPAVDYADPAQNKLISRQKSYIESRRGKAREAALAAASLPTEAPLATPESGATTLEGDLASAAPMTLPGSAGAQESVIIPEGDIHMGSSADYSQLEGVTTFRGSNYRDGGAYGEIPEDPDKLTVVWRNSIGSLDNWSGVGWTGQASVVRWPDDLRQAMNISAEKKAKDGLVEAIYATLDGHIYFLDLEDGEATRKPINIGAPIKGSLTVDPRGVPLLYCGQGIYDVQGKRVDCGTRIWSLIDQEKLFFINGQDKAALRAWRAFDCSPLVDGETDTMITAGENGVLYKVALNSQWDGKTVSIDPEVDRYVYEQSADGKLGTENSVVIYNNYVYFATNIGIIECVDLNTMELVWSLDAKDDIDATMVIETEPDGLVALYAANELDKRGHKGTSQMFKINALTGELLWKRDSENIYQNNENGGGSFATPAVGKGELSDLVYFHICRTEDTKGIVYALNKQTGETVWSKGMGSYGWSSPTCLYTPSGKGYVLVGSASGELRLLDGLTGKTVAEVELKGNIEGTPAVFDDMIIVGTRSSYIYGIKIS